MADPVEVKRRLAAIFAADVEGYSRLMGADEVATLDALTARREILDRLIASHGGRIANTAGDSVLAEFASAVDAVRCAMEAQDTLTKANSTLPESRHINFRMGVHVGDVMVRAGDLFGDGVNIAARLQTLAKAGGLCISGVTYDQVRKILPLEFTDLGMQTVKNIEEPVRAFVVGPQKPAIQSPEGPQSILLDPAKPPLLPNKPSIAVLPFQNMSGDPDQEYFADGMAEDIITALSRFKSLFVIARNSSFVYKAKAVDIKQVGRELGVQYVLEGSVRKSGSRVRITGQLIEAATGAHLWANNFDGSLENIFELQDSVAVGVVGAVVPQLMLASAELLERKPADSWGGYDHYLRGLALFHQRTLEKIKQAQGEFEAAISLDPNLALAYVQAAFCIHNRYYTYLHTISDDERAAAIKLASRALELAPADDAVLGVAAFTIGNLDDDVERGLALADRAIAINPNFASAWSIKGYLTALMGDMPDARQALNEAVRLNPLDLANAIAALRSHMVACAGLRQHDDFTGWARKLLALSPTDVHGIVALYSEAMRLGNSAEADKQLARIQTLYPHLRKQHLRQMYLRYRKPEHQAAAVERINLSVGIPD
ncbi:adenylate/guanylate cyclase domain-containing protein [Bradyrhizobium sp.]|uniref:adenylate/guanylate cyclase domain-containing protein n=1 Tax=Bradyrhizobium sp. TaxID=376 RepID=UPI0025BE183D|nr:adenylate/guanylate cyclase domain-containing protein [Bradyrhizobium sp.]